MSLKSWDCADLFVSAEVYPPTDLDNANTNMTAVDTSQYTYNPPVSGVYDPGSRFYVLVTVLPNEVTDTGMTFKIQDCATSGGSYADCAKSTTGSSVPGTTKVERHVVELSFTPTAGRRFIKVVGTKVDTDSDVTVQAHLIAFTNV